MDKKNFKQRITSFVLALVVVVGVLPLSAMDVTAVTSLIVSQTKSLNKNFEGEWHNDDGSVITITNLQTDFFDFEAMLLYYPNNTARQHDNPNIGSLNGKAIAINNYMAQMLYREEWSGENREVVINFELSENKLIVKINVLDGNSYEEFTLFGFGYGVNISGAYYKKGEDTFENDLEGIYWIVEPILDYDNIYYCSWCELLKNVVDISEIKIIIKRHDWNNGTVYISGGHGIETNEYFIDEKKQIFVVYYHGDGGLSLSYYTFEEFDNYIKFYYGDYAKLLIVFRKINSDKIEFNEYQGIINEEHIGDKYALAQGTRFITDFIYDDCKLRGNRYESNNFIDFKLGDKWGFINKNGKIIIPFIFDDIELIDEKRAFAKYNGKYGILDIEKSIIETNSNNNSAAATPISSKITVNGKEINFDAYTIDGNNYFKVRDLAFVLNGTSSQFDVSYDGTKNAISLISGKLYNPVGGEMASKGSETKTASPTTANIYLDNKEINLSAYSISGSNYFNLRDIGDLLSFNVEYDNAKNMIIITTLSFNVKLPIRSFLSYKKNELIPYGKDVGDAKEFPWDFTYSDNLFSGDSYKYNHDLAIMSLGMAIVGYSTVDSDKYWGKNFQVDEQEFPIEENMYLDKNIKKLNRDNRQGYLDEAYHNLNFEEIEYRVYDRSLNDESSHVALGLAKKTIRINGKYYTLVSVVLRGGGYGSEWSDNFNAVGDNVGYHEGFYQSARKAVIYIKYYLARLKQENKIEGDVKLWITGYSRGGAIANLTAAELIKDKQLEQMNLVKLNDFYTYTFATPRNVIAKNSNDFREEFTLSDNNKKVKFYTSENKFNNIFNIINPSDIVPALILSDWGFARYGIDKYFPTYMILTEELKNIQDVVDKYNIIKQKYSAIVQNSDSFPVYKNSFHYRVIAKIEKALFDLAPNLNSYKNGLQKVLTGFFHIMNIKDHKDKNEWSKEKDETEWSKKVDYLYSIAYRYGQDGLNTYIASKILFPILDIAPFGIGDILRTIIVIAEMENFSPLKSLLVVDNIAYTPPGCKESIVDLILTIFIIMQGKGTIDNLIIDNLIQGFVDENHEVYSLIILAQQHYPEIYLAWMLSIDADDLDAISTYKKATFNCPVDVNIYDSHNNLLASVINNQIIVDILPVEINDDKKEIYLYGNGDYIVEIIATDSGNMDYSITEYGNNTQLRKVMFNNIFLTQNEKFIGNINSEIDTNVNNYILNSDIQGDISLYEDLKNDSVHNINISVFASGNGVVYGNQIVTKGDNVIIMAIPNENDVFIGWYENGIEINNTNEVYSFIASENKTLEARFISEIITDSLSPELALSTESEFAQNNHLPKSQTNIIVILISVTLSIILSCMICWLVFKHLKQNKKL